MRCQHNERFVDLDDCSAALKLLNHVSTESLNFTAKSSTSDLSVPALDAVECHVGAQDGQRFAQQDCIQFPHNRAATPHTDTVAFCTPGVNAISRSLQRSDERLLQTNEKRVLMFWCDLCRSFECTARASAFILSCSRCPGVFSRRC